jgi:hypothetical protein
MVMPLSSSRASRAESRPGQAAGRDASVLIRCLAIGLGCALFLGLVVLRG